MVMDNSLWMTSSYDSNIWPRLLRSPKQPLRLLRSLERSLLSQRLLRSPLSFPQCMTIASVKLAPRASEEDARALIAALGACQTQFLEREPRWEVAGALALRVVGLMLRRDCPAKLLEHLWAGDAATGFAGLCSLVSFGEAPPPRLFGDIKNTRRVLCSPAWPPVFATAPALEQSDGMTILSRVTHEVDGGGAHPPPPE